MKFKKGDLVECVVAQRYHVTDVGVTCEVLKISGGGLRVEVVQHPSDRFIGNRFWVDAKDFDYAMSQVQQKINSKYTI